MSTAKINPSQAASLALNTITNQIRLPSSMPAEHCQQAVAGLEPIVTANFAMVVDASNDQIDEFNALIDELEARDDELLAQAKVVAELRNQLVSAASQSDAEKAELVAKAEDLDGQLFELKRAAMTLQNKVEAAKVSARANEKELIELRAMDPASLKRRIKDKDKLLEEQRKAIAKHKSNEAAYRKDILDVEAKKAELIRSIRMQDEELDRRAAAIAELESYRHVKTIWFQHLNRTFYGADGVGWNVYVVDYGLKSKTSYLVNDLDWKIHAMRQDGGGCAVMISQWLNVVYPMPWGDKAPTEMTEAINGFMLEALEKSHAHLLPRAEWAKTVSIHELGLSARITNLLEAAGFLTLYKVMSHQGGQLNNIKGLGEKLVGQVVYACELAVKAWEGEQHTEVAA